MKGNCVDKFVNHRCTKRINECDDGAVDYKFYDKSIIKITCKLIDNDNNVKFEVLKFN